MQGLLLRIFLTSLIGIVSFIGDKGLLNGKSEIVRALSDNLTHAIVGGLTWALVLILSKKPIFDNVQGVFICFLISSLIDLDHFIAAGSWNINDATHLKHRPFLHCTTIPIALWMVLSLISKFADLNFLITFAWMILASFISHHVRDGNRRGLWFWPFGSTQPIPYYLYLTICMILPYFIQWLMTWQLAKDTKNLPIINIV